jgi:hypothetical protein
VQGNENDGLESPESGIGGSVLRDEGLMFLDPARGEFRLADGSPGKGLCGAASPGASDMWALRVLQHDPYLHGDSWKAGSCGDDVIQPGECDAGGPVPEDGCTADCEPDEESDGVPDAIDNCPLDDNPGQEDLDLDGLRDACDFCPHFPSASNRDVDGNGIGDACECGDADGDGVVSVLDLVALNEMIFDPARATPRCDTNHDAICDVLDLIGAQRKIFGGAAYCAAYPPP